jgi:hypothetical protein
MATHDKIKGAFSFHPACLSATDCLMRADQISPFVLSCAAKKEPKMGRIAVWTTEGRPAGRGAWMTRVKKAACEAGAFPAWPDRERAHKEERKMVFHHRYDRGQSDPRHIRMTNVSCDTPAGGRK